AALRMHPDHEWPHAGRRWLALVADVADVVSVNGPTAERMPIQAGKSYLCGRPYGATPKCASADTDLACSANRSVRDSGRSCERLARDRANPAASSTLAALRTASSVDASHRRCLLGHDCRR